MPHSKVCEYCEAAFSARRSDARFCGQRCNYRAKKGYPKITLCAGCSVDISNRHGNAKYCERCYEGRAADHGVRDMVCPECGNGFKAKLPQIHCSYACAGKSSRRAQLSEARDVVCVACEKVFRTYDCRPVACSVACKQWAKKYPGVLRQYVRQCVQCGKTYSDGQMRRRYCSERCSKYANKVRRRGHISAAYVEDVTVAQLVERDGTDCRLCFTPIDFNAKWPDRLSVSIDHAIPISLGGEHSLDNTQLAHAVCNTAKGNRLVFISEVMPSCQIQRRETSLPHT